jgi:ribonuclease HI
LSISSAKFVLRFDGGSRGNPGPAGIGVVVEADGVPVVTLGRYIGTATVNVAEYTALITGLEKALELGAREIEVFGDSELVVKQINGQYRVKHPQLIPLHQRAEGLLSQFSRAAVRHNPRGSNQLADALYNAAVTRRGEVDDPGDAPAASPPAQYRAGAPSSVPPVPAAGSPSRALIPTQCKCPNCASEVVVLRPSPTAGSYVCPCGEVMKPKVQ